MSLKFDRSTYQFLIDFLSVFIFLLTALLVGFWLMQNSINAYVIQTYHRPAFLTSEQQFWQKGAQIGDTLIQNYETLIDQIKAVNAQMIASHNSALTKPSFEEVTVKQSVESTTPVNFVPINNLAIDSIKTDSTNIAAFRLQIPANAEDAANDLPTQNLQFVSQSTQLSLGKNDKVFFAGDSMMQGIAPHIQKYLQNNHIDSINLSKQSTGLSYPKFFDWNKTIKETINKDKNIKLLIVMLGPNDPWDFYKDNKYIKFGSEAWKEEYQSRMSDIIQFAQSKQVKIIWITPPNMKKNQLNEQMNVLNDVMSDILLKSHVKVVDSRPIMGGLNNRYNDYLEKEGKKIKMRTNDGIHFTPEGQRILAKEIQSLLQIESVS